MNPASGNTLSDEELVLQYRGGPDPEQAFQEIFSRYHTRIVGWCFRFTGDPECAADIAQEVFLKVFKHIAGFRGDSKFSTWLYVVVRSQCREAAKTQSSEPSHLGGAIPPNLPDNRQINIESRLDRDRSHRNLWRFIRSAVDRREAEIMRLHYRDEMQLDAITRLLNLRNASGAKAYIVSARRKLERSLRDHGATHSMAGFGGSSTMD